MVHRKSRIDSSLKVPRAKDVPVTQAMLFNVRDELKAFTGAKIDGVNANTFLLKSELNGFKAEVSGVKSEVNGLKSEIHRLAILMEEQNARNIIVLDGLTNHFERQERIERA